VGVLLKIFVCLKKSRKNYGDIFGYIQMNDVCNFQRGSEILILTILFVDGNFYVCWTLFVQEGQGENCPL
jgi:hypothetical protein